MTSSPPVRRVLLVDDTPELRKVVRNFLERKSDGRYAVVGEAGDGQHGLSLAVELLPDVVLLDLSMPVMDGLTALPLIREQVPDAKVVVFTGVKHRHLGSELAARGAAAWVEKGRPLPELLALIDEL